MKIINYMAHEVDACGMKYSPSGHVARVATTLLKVDEIDGVPVMVCDSGAVQNCPPKKDGHLHCESVRQASIARAERSGLPNEAAARQQRESSWLRCI
jgi:hypothetical protein